MRILVTGSEGSIGDYIVSEIYEKYPSSQVLRVSRDDSISDDNRSIYYFGDLKDPNLYKQIFAQEEVNLVIACAGIWNGLNQDQSVLENNKKIMENLFSNITDTVEQIIFISSSAVYKDNFSDMDELIYTPESTYGRSKYLSEIMLRDWTNDTKKRYTIYRPFHVVSPREKFQKGRSHVCTDFAYRIIDMKENIEPLEMPEDIMIGFMWARDFANIIISNIENQKTFNEIFNIGTNEEHTLQELAQEIIIQAIELELINTSYKPLLLIPPSATENTRFKKMDEILDVNGITDFKALIKQFLIEKYLKHERTKN